MLLRKQNKKYEVKYLKKILVLAVILFMLVSGVLLLGQKFFWG